MLTCGDCAMTLPWTCLDGLVVAHSAGMHQAAEEAGIPVLWCMSTPRYILESLNHPAATAARGSVDFAQDGGGNLLRFGYATQLLWAVGLAPSKDSFWTVGPTQPPDGTYLPHQTARHPNPELHTIVAAMSMGPVGIADRVNVTDADLVMRTCMSNGTLLNPTRPIAASDVGFALDKGKRQSTGQSVNAGKVWRTMSLVHDGCDFYVWHYVLGFKLSVPYQVTLDDLAPALGGVGGSQYQGENYLYKSFHSPACVNGSVLQFPNPSAAAAASLSNGVAGESIQGADDVQCVQMWNTMPGGSASNGAGPVLGKRQTRTTATAGNGTDVLELSVLTPLLINGFAVMGEVGKYVSVSPARFKTITCLPNATLFNIVGAPGENLAFTVLAPFASSAGAGASASARSRSRRSKDGGSGGVGAATGSNDAAADGPIKMKVVVVDVVVPSSGSMLVTVGTA